MVDEKFEDIKCDECKKTHDEYLRIREFFSEDFYNHGSEYLDPGSWAVWQIHNPQKNEGVVMAFHRATSLCDHAKIQLKGLPNGAKFKD